MAKDAAKKDEKLIAKNRRALHDYAIEEHLEAGLALVGSEVKSCRDAKVSLQDAYVTVERGEAFLVNAHIAEYIPANRFNHDPVRRRKLLLHRREIDKLEVRLKQQGQAAVVLSLYFAKGRVKADIGVGKGKSYVDRRDAVRDREAKRDIQRVMRRSRKER